MGSGQDWNEIVSTISKKYYCITIDLPGHGQSTNLAQMGDIWNFNSLSKRLSDLLAHLKIKTVSLVGYSLGGRVALHFTLNYPQLVSTLILESTSAGIEKEKEREARFQNDLLLSKKLTTGSLDTFLNNWYGQPLFFGIKTHNGYLALFKRRKQNNPHLLAKVLESFSPGRQPYLMDKLSSLKIPLNLICGENDDKYLNLMRGIKKHNPHFNLKVFENSGHNIHFEKPVLFAKHLLQVLSLQTPNKI